MILPVHIIGSPVLRKTAKEIDKHYNGLETIIFSMFDTMYESDGVGLAAPQIGKSIRLFIIDASPMEEEDSSLKGFKKIFINARITERSGGIVTFEEGCLSIPDFREDIKREDQITIEYYDDNFEFHTEQYSGLAARIIQHEYDHLDGKLFTDKVSPLKKKLIKNKLLAISKGKFEHRYKVKLHIKKDKR